MKPNQNLEDPTHDYVPPLDAMVRAMGSALPGENPAEWSSEDYQSHHEGIDQLVRDEQIPPDKRHCYSCSRWVSLGLEDEESEDPRCSKCGWQLCVCGACGCKYRGVVKR